ncbi:retrotransposon protein, putative, ty1-copia subclass [Tanacetum coccineum]
MQLTLVAYLLPYLFTRWSDLRGFFEKQKLTGPDFIDWYQQLRIVLSVEDKLDYLEQPIPPALVPAQPGQQVAPKALAAHAAWVKGSKEVTRLMLMKLEIQRNLENLHAHKMLQGLKTLFAQQAEQELNMTVRDFHSCKQEEGQSISSYILKMKIYIDNLKRLGQPMTPNLGNMGKTVNELHAMLKLHEQTLTKKDPTLHAIRAGNVQKKNNKQKKQSLEEELSPGLRGSRKLKLGALTLYVGNGQRAAVEAIRSYHLFSRNNIVYFSVIPRDAIFENDLSNSNTNDSSIYVVSNKRAKLNLDSTLLWHCRLGHISKKRIEKLQHDGLLNSTDLRDFERCVPFNNLHNLFGLCPEDCYARILNMVPTKKFKKTPYEVWHGQAPKLSYLKVCGCEALVKRDTLTKPDKLEPGSIKCIFVGYPKETMGYSFYYPLENKVSVARNAKFLDNSLITQEVSGSLEDLKIIQEEDTYPSINTSSYHKEDDLEIDEPQSDIIPICRSTRTRHALDRMCLETDIQKRTKNKAKNDKTGHGMEFQALKLVLRLFLGYPKETIGYSFYYPLENKVLVAQNSKFLENSLITQEASGSLEDLEIIQKEDTHPSINTSSHHKEDDLEIDEPQSDIIPIRRSTRTRHAPNRMCLYIDAEEHELGDLGEPAKYKVSLLDPESDKWLNAMNVEIQSMKDNEVWDLVDLPPNGKTVGRSGSSKRKPTWTEIWQMDVKTVFLNEHISEEIYMEQPEGFVNPKYPNRVCKLKRSIYGLKQESRQWNKRFDDEIKKFGFTQNRDEPCVYLKASGSNVTFLILYVGDILIMRNNILMLQDVKSYLGRCFAMKDLEEAAYILGIEIYKDRSRQLIGLRQSAYIEKILKRFHMENSNVENLVDLYWTAVKNILKYLRNTKDMFLVYVEAKYIAAYDASKEAVWVRKSISGLGVIPKIEEPIKMYCDNTGAITIANELGITKGARHFRAKVYYLREVIEYVT